MPALFGGECAEPVSLEEFKRHIAGEYPAIYAELTRGLAEVFGFAREPQEGELILSYVLGKPSVGVYRTRPIR